MGACRVETHLISRRYSQENHLRLTKVGEQRCRCGARGETAKNDTMQQFFPTALLTTCCKCLLLGNIFVFCRPSQPSYEYAARKIELGTYRLQPMKNEKLQDLPPEYRLVSVLDSGYLISTDTGLSYAVGATGTINLLDERIPAATASGAHPRYFAAADDAVWSLHEQLLTHSKASEGKEIMDTEVQVLWFSRQQIMLWGNYRLHDGSVTNGVQLYSLDNSDRLQLAATINEPLIRTEVPTFKGAENFIAGGVTGQDFWLWTSEGGLLLFRADPLKQGNYKLEDDAEISLPRLTHTVKDIGFALQISADGEIGSPPYVLSVVAGEGDRSAVYIAVKNPAAD